MAHLSVLPRNTIGNLQRDQAQFEARAAQTAAASEQAAFQVATLQQRLQEANAGVEQANAEVLRHPAQISRCGFSHSAVLLTVSVSGLS